MPPDHRQALAAQGFVVVGQPLLLEALVSVAALPERRAVGQEVANLQIEAVGAGGFVALLRRKDAIDQIGMDDRVRSHLLERPYRGAGDVEALPVLFPGCAVDAQHLRRSQRHDVQAAIGRGLAASAGVDQQHRVDGVGLSEELHHCLGGRGVFGRGIARS